ncbi:hypothetical protein [Ottowia testudinis]|uniref:Uncharacterized protein n=1 Tax=Ottowia testudinis TaxID=2816950 RepID=A0A975CGG5_9BURK|nr:hypothetical protein [Ottowia testudinis]QTD44651.1 hypothetical protein J1M35_16390 [Ottowia testudinis]
MRSPRTALTVTALLAAMLAPPAAHAFWGALGKLGSLGGKAATSAAGKGAAATAGKGVAAGGASVAGVELAEGAAQAGKAGAGLAAHSGDDIARASGLGKAVPDELAAMLRTPGKTLLDVPDAGARHWLSTPTSKLGAADADLMVTDYVRLLEGKSALGPAAAPATPAAAKAGRRTAAPPAPKLPTERPASSVPWHAAELLVRAAHLGHTGAQQELDRLCRAPAAQATPAACAQRKPTAAPPAAAARKPAAP